MKSVFVTATDTGVGKTLICGLLGRYLLEKKVKVITQKWIETGCKGGSRDIKNHLRVMGIKKSAIKDYIPCISPYTFEFAASPHLAAAVEKRTINADRIKNCYEFLLKYFDCVVAEGVGGALVPFNKNDFVIDIACSLSMPVVIVVDNRLGAINQTLLTIEAVKNRGMKIIGIIFTNRNKKTNETVLKDNPKIITKIGKEKLLGVLPYQKDINLLYKAFIPIGDRIAACCPTVIAMKNGDCP